MSLQDHHRDRKALAAVLGTPFTLTVATNSLKFAFDDDNHRHRYLWLDPVWVLEDAGGVARVRSEDCPYEAGPFKSWAAGLDSLRTASLWKISRERDGTLLLFEQGWRLRSFDSPAEDERAWYDNFYWRGTEAD